MYLNAYDLHWCVQRLPRSLRNLIKKEEIVVSGGYIRSCIQNETIKDIDLFIPDASYAEDMVLELAEGNKKKVHKTENALTVLGGKYTIQFITRWTYDNPQDVISSFDFTVCQAAFWWDHYCQKWDSICSEQYYSDIAAKRLIYTSPRREEEPGGSMLRVLKYYQKGFRITLDSYAKIITRLVSGVRLIDGDNISWQDDHYEISQMDFSMIVKGLLIDVDPTLDPDHIINESIE
jgi:hypothetical protein